MPTMTDDATLGQFLRDLAADLKEPVAKIEAGPYLTKGHYGDYMAILAPADSLAKRRILATALMLAGADRDGVADALRLTTTGDMVTCRH